MRTARRSMFRLAPLLLLPILVTVLGACGSSGKAAVKIDATPEGVAQAARQTLDAGTVHLEFDVQLSIDGHDASIHTTGQADMDARRLAMSMDLSSLFSQLAGGVPASISSAFAKPVDVVLDRSTVYMRMPLLAAQLHTDKAWVKVDLSSAVPGLGSLTNGGATQDPTAFLEFLEGTGKVQEVGPDQVRGVDTSHYRGTYTVQNALDATTGAAHDALERAVQSMEIPESTLNADVPFDVWVDGDGRVRKLQLALDATSFSSGKASGAVDMTAEFYDFGQPVQIEVPSDAEALDVSKLVPGN
jgi:hypothetical protein